MDNNPYPTIPVERRLVSFPLSDIVEELLGEQHYVSVSPSIAKILFNATLNKHIIYIQFPGEDDTTINFNVDIFGQKLTIPRLWRLEKFLPSTERWLQQKIKSEHDREKRFIFEANCKLVAYHVRKFLGIDSIDISHVTARRLLEKNDIGRIKAFGVPKLYTTIKEIP